MLSSIPYGTFANYSPRGPSDFSKKSREICAKIKAGKFNLESAVPHLQSPQAEILIPFLDPTVTFVPVPKSHPLVEGALWPSLKIAEQLLNLGYGSEISTLIKRTSRIRKSATAGPGERPSVREHYETLAIERNLFPFEKITLIDDVITKGSTVFVYALHLHEQFPQVEIRVFALIRTQGLIPNIASIVDPSTGTISYNQRFDDVNRNP